MSDGQILFTPDGVQSGKLHALTSYLNTLEGKGVDVNRVELTDSNSVELEYQIREATEHEQEQELFYVLGSYLPVRDSGNLDSLEVTAHASDGQTGQWTVEREWCEKYDREEWTERGFLRRVIASSEGVQ